MLSKEHLALVAVLLELGATAWYLVDTIRKKGETLPNWFTWLGLGALGTVGTIAIHKAGGGPGVYVSGTFAVAAYIIGIVSLIPGYGEGIEELTLIDKVIGLAAIASVVLLATNLIGLPVAAYATIAWVGDGSFAWFTWRKAVEKPRSENPYIWSLSFVAAVMGVVALSIYSYATAAYPVYLAIGNGIIAGTIAVQRSRKPAKHTKGARA